MCTKFLKVEQLTKSVLLLKNVTFVLLCSEIPILTEKLIKHDCMPVAFHLQRKHDRVPCFETENTKKNCVQFLDNFEIAFSAIFSGVTHVRLKGETSLESD